MMTEFINIYNRTRFELRNSFRKIDFRFMLYDGSNYSELVEYIHGKSPYTHIWEERLLKKGCYYTFSGSDRTFQEVPLHFIRACIASNPILVEGERSVPLAITTSEAEEYLRMSPMNRVFPYESLCDTFSYDPERGCFLLFTTKNHRGLSIDRLPSYAEWYVGCNDNLCMLFDYTKPVYEYNSHLVKIDIGVRAKADAIIDLIYEINMHTQSAAGHCVFNPSWEDTARYRTLYATCLNKDRFREFVIVLYNYLYESTKARNKEGFRKNKELLPVRFRNDIFVLKANEFRNFYTHGQAEYESPFMSGPRLFAEFIGVPYPRFESDYETLQMKLLDEFIAFLRRLKDYVMSKTAVHGVITCDDFGNIFCGEVLLMNDVAPWVGCSCDIYSKVSNLSPGPRRYPFFSNFPVVTAKMEGEISIDSSGAACVDGIYIGHVFNSLQGHKAVVNRFTPAGNTIGDSEARLRALNLTIEALSSDGERFTLGMFRDEFGLALSGEKNADFPDDKMALKSISFQWITNHWVIVGAEGIENSKDEQKIIERDSRGEYHIGEVLVAARFGQAHVGKKAEVLSTIPNSNPRSSYKLFSSNIRIK